MSDCYDANEAEHAANWLFNEASRDVPEALPADTPQRLRAAARLILEMARLLIVKDIEIHGARLALTHPHGEIGVGDEVVKIKGYPWPGEVRAVFTNSAGEVRYVVECTADAVSGALHIFNGEQLAKKDEARPKREVVEIKAPTDPTAKFVADPDWLQRSGALFFDSPSTPEPKPEPDRCGNCRFFKTYGDRGECFRNPPAPPISAPMGNHWPRPRESDWCGQHERRA